VNLVHRSHVVFPGNQPQITIGGENVRLKVAMLMSKVKHSTIATFFLLLSFCSFLLRLMFS
jgi:hypothetical protein